jgi:aspartate aminotransferase-like enzyme
MVGLNTLSSRAEKEEPATRKAIKRLGLNAFLPGRALWQIVALGEILDLGFEET